MKMNNMLAAILLSWMLFSCSRNNDNMLVESKDSNALQSTEALDEKQQPPVLQQQVSADTAKQKGIDAIPSATDWDKKVIKTGTLKLQVKDHKRFSETVYSSIKQFGGYTAAEEQLMHEGVIETTVAIKVPAAHFESLINQLSGPETKVMERKISTDDVTTQVVDTKARLEAKKQMRLKYLDFLQQSKNMAEVLQVQQEINGIQEEIEAASGRVSYLQNQALFSTINLLYYQPLAGYNPSGEEPGFFKKVTAAFSLGMNWLAEIFVALISIWPLLLLVTVAWFGWRKLKASKPVAHNM